MFQQTVSSDQQTERTNKPPDAAAAAPVQTLACLHRCSSTRRLQIFHTFQNRVPSNLMANNKRNKLFPLTPVFFSHTQKRALLIQTVSSTHISLDLRFVVSCNNVHACYNDDNGNDVNGNNGGDIRCLKLNETQIGATLIGQNVKLH